MFSLATLVVAAAVLFFMKLGGPPLEPFDDATYADIAKNIVKTGDWLHFRWLGGATFLEKPPLQLWLIAASFKIFGQSEFAARLFSSLCGLGTILVTVLLGRELFSSNTAGLMSGCLLLSVDSFFAYSTRVMMDVPVTFFITCTLFFLYFGLKQDRFLIWLFYGVSFALAILTKSVVGLVGPATSILFLLATHRHQILTRNFLIGNCVGVLLLAPWHIWAYWRYGTIFLREYFGYHVWQRITGEIGVHRHSFWFFAQQLFETDTLLLILAIFGAVALIYRAIRDNQKGNWLVIIWGCSVFLPISLARSKLFWYVVPLYPPLCIYAGYALHRLVVGSVARRVVALALLLPFVWTAYNFQAHRMRRDWDDDPIYQLKNALIEITAQSPPGEVFYVYRFGAAVPLTNFYADRKAVYLFDNPAALAVFQKIPSDYVTNGFAKYLPGASDLVEFMATQRNSIFILEKATYEELTGETNCSLRASTSTLMFVNACN